MTGLKKNHGASEHGAMNRGNMENNGGAEDSESSSVRTDTISDRRHIPDSDDDSMDIVISGISLRLPYCNNIQEFHDNLLSGIDMLEIDEDNDGDNDNVYWNRLKNKDKFDSSFFGISDEKVDYIDPQVRMMLEVVTEAIIDAGENCSSIRDRIYGVYVGIGTDNGSDSFCCNPDRLTKHIASNISTDNIARRLQLILNLRGPSHCVTGGDISDSLALERAYIDIYLGDIDGAIVVGSNLNLTLSTLYKYSQQSHRLDEDNNLVGSDGIVAIVLQRMNSAKRAYATILNCRSIAIPLESDGYCNTSSEKFLREIYNEADIDPSDVEYIELNTDRGEGQDDIKTLSTVMCADRDLPLMVGSVKSNLGHTFAAGGLISIAKVLVSFEEGMIPANGHLFPFRHHTCRQHEGILQTVTENTRYMEGLFAVHTLDSNGYQSHCILYGNIKQRMIHYMASKNTRLAIYCARTKNAVENALKVLHRHSEDIEFQALTEKIIHSNEMPYRGYCILNGLNKEIKIQKCSVGSKGFRKIWFVFSGIGAQWPGMACNMMKLDSFKSSILKSSEVLKKFGINLYKLIKEGADKSYDRPLNLFIITTAIQIALVDVLKEMGIEADGVVGHTIGEIACGYANKCLTAEEAMVIAYWEGFSIQELNPSPGKMAEVGLSWDESITQCPDKVVPVWQNAPKTVTVSGPTDKVSEFIKQLEQDGIHTAEIKTGGIAYNAPAINAVAPILKKYFPKSCKEEHSEYIKKLTSPVWFHDRLKQIPADSIILVIGPDDSLLNRCDESLNDNIFHIGLMRQNHPDNVEFFFTSLGKCYLEGMTFYPLGIFPKVNFPVPRGTPSLSSLVEWDHSKSWHVPEPEDCLGGSHGQWSDSSFLFDTALHGKDKELLGHMINGIVTIPVALYVVMVWKAVAIYFGKVHYELSIGIEKFKVIRQLAIPETGIIKFTVNMIPLLGNFEITTDNELIVSGRVVEHGRQYSQHLTSEKYEQNMMLSQDDIYFKFETRGHNYCGKYRSLKSMDIAGNNGHLEWTGDWITYLDGMIQLYLLSNQVKSVHLPYEIKSIMICPNQHRTIIQEGIGPVTLDTDVQEIKSGGVSIVGVKTTSEPVVKSLTCTVNTVTFIPYDKNVIEDSDDVNEVLNYIKVCSKLAAHCVKNLLESTDKDVCTASLIETLKQHTERMGDYHIEDITDLEKDLTISGPVRKYLDMLITIPVDENYPHNVRALRQNFDDNKIRLQDDCMFTSFNSTSGIKQCLDILCENLELKNLRILDISVCKDSDLLALTQEWLQVFDRSSECYVTGHPSETRYRYLNWNIADEFPPEIKPFDVVVLDNVLTQVEATCITVSLSNIIDAIVEDGFILIREYTVDFLLRYVLHVFYENKMILKGSKSLIDEDSWNKLFKEYGLNVIARKKDMVSTLFLLRKQSNKLEKGFCSTSTGNVGMCIDLIHIDSSEADWFGNLSKKMESWSENSEDHLSHVVCLTGDSTYGTMDLIPKIPKSGNKPSIRFVYIEDDKMELTQDNVYSNVSFLCQYKKNVISNIYKNGEWGRYHHLPISKNLKQKMKSSCVSVKGIGSPCLPTLVAKPESLIDSDTDRLACYPKYCTLTNVGVAHTYGLKCSDDSKKSLGLSIYKRLGLGFSGYDDGGSKILGISTNTEPSTKLHTYKYLTWTLPDWLSMEDASVLLRVYLLAYYALFVCSKIRKDQSILITGDTNISKATVAIASEHCSQVFVSYDIYKKIDLCKTEQDDENTVVNTYTQLDDVLRATKGIGVDIILNSCKDTTLVTSHLLKPGGHLINIDEEQTDRFTLDGDLLQKNCTQSCISLENILEDDIRYISKLISQGLKLSHIKPLTSTVYDCSNLEMAYSHKLVDTDHNITIKFGDESNHGPTSLLAHKLIICSEQKCYIIVNGMNHFGLLMADWLIERNATKLILTSSCDERTGYEKRLLQQWYTRGIIVNVYNKDINTSEDCYKFIQHAKTHGPIGGIFYLPNVDESVMDMVPNSSFPLARHIDEVTRTHCNKTLDWFVVMPVTCCNANLNQSAQSFVMKGLQRIIDQRVTAGYQGLCAGLDGVEKETRLNDAQVMMTVLDNLECLLQQDEHVVRLSIHSPNKKSKKSGTKLYETIKKFHAVDIDTLHEETLCGHIFDDGEIEQIRDLLVTETGINITSQQISILTRRELERICDNDVEWYNEIFTKKDRTESIVNTSRDYQSCVTILNDNNNNNNEIPVYVIFDEDDYDDILRLSSMIKSCVYGICKTNRDIPVQSVQCQAGYIIQQLFLNNNLEAFVLIGHKMACAVAIEMALQLQSFDLDVIKHIVCIEGSMKYVALNDEICYYQDMYTKQDEVDKEVEALLTYIDLYTHISDHVTTQILEVFESEELTLKEKVASLAPHVFHWLRSEKKSNSLSLSELNSKILHYVITYMLVGDYKPCSKYKGKMTLIRGRGRPKDVKTPSDYFLSKVYTGGVSVHILNTGHKQFLYEMRNEISDTINAVLCQLEPDK